MEMSWNSERGNRKTEDAFLGAARQGLLWRGCDFDGSHLPSIGLFSSLSPSLCGGAAGGSLDAAWLRGRCHFACPCHSQSSQSPAQHRTPPAAPPKAAGARGTRTEGSPGPVSPTPSVTVPGHRSARCPQVWEGRGGVSPLGVPGGEPLGAGGAG